MQNNLYYYFAIRLAVIFRISSETTARIVAKLAMRAFFGAAVPIHYVSEHDMPQKMHFLDFFDFHNPFGAMHNSVQIRHEYFIVKDLGGCYNT